MKKKDLSVVLASVIVATIFSFIISSKLITTPKSRSQKVEVVKPITSEFNLPDKAIFNTEAVNPTRLIQIAPNANDKPFANK